MVGSTNWKVKNISKTKFYKVNKYHNFSTIVTFNDVENKKYYKLKFVGVLFDGEVTWFKQDYRDDENDVLILKKIEDETPLNIYVEFLKEIEKMIIEKFDSYKNNRK